MKTPEEMADYFKSMPSKKTEPNPYWLFDEESVCIKSTLHMISPCYETKPLSLKESKPTLIKIREFFRRYYESFHSEAQVLCVTSKDSEKLINMGIPVLTKGQIGPFGVVVMVLPQNNSMGNSNISEWFWQNKIIGEGIKPIARIHSHHILDPYQSSTDYSTLNSGTLEIVIGKINDERLKICYWLDVPGTDIKSKTFLAKENENFNDGTFTVIPHIFHEPNMKMALNTGARVMDCQKM